MSKRARLDMPLRHIPHWLKGSGLTDEALRQLMDWMEDEELAFFPLHVLANSEKHPPFHHPIAPECEVDRAGDMRIVCVDCQERCECCDEYAPLLGRPKNHVNSPHDRVCYSCARENPCWHADDNDAWPDFCDGCEQGCRESKSTRSGEEVVATCERCRGDKN